MAHLPRWPEVADEEVVAEIGAVGGFGGAMAGSDDGHEFEGFACFLEGSDDLRRAGRIDVGVEFAHKFPDTLPRTSLRLRV
jgi:hypothetical protein